MFCPYKKYELPSKGEIDVVKDMINRKYPYSFTYPQNDLVVKIFKTMGNYTLDSVLTINSLAYKLGFGLEKDFENKCEHLFNVSKYAIRQSLKTKNNTTIHPNSFMTLPLKDIKSCANYNDFVASLSNLDTKLSVLTDNDIKTKSSDIVLYDIKSNHLIIMDEYKP